MWNIYKDLTRPHHYERWFGRNFQLWLGPQENISIYNFFQKVWAKFKAIVTYFPPLPTPTPSFFVWVRMHLFPWLWYAYHLNWYEKWIGFQWKLLLLEWYAKVQVPQSLDSFLPRWQVQDAYRLLESLACFTTQWHHRMELLKNQIIWITWLQKESRA